MAHNLENHNPTDPGQQRPSEAEIQAMLGDFRPSPSTSFYTRMGSSPWAVRSKQTSGYPTTRRPHLSIAFAGVLAVLLLFLGALAVPSIRATAQRIALLFLRSESDHSAVLITPEKHGELDYDFALTLEEAAAKAGFLVNEPAWLPPFLHLNGVAYLPESRTVILDYGTEATSQVVRIKKQWVANLKSYANIGASAEVEAVRIGNLEGEYVSGGWRHPGMATALANTAPGMKITLEASWDPSGGIQILRWQQDEMLYEILSISATTPQVSNLVKADLIAIAESME